MQTAIEAIAAPFHLQSQCARDFAEGEAIAMRRLRPAPPAHSAKRKNRIQRGARRRPEQFERLYNVVLSEIAEETGNEHKVAKTDLVLQLGDARADGVRAADNCDLAKPALGFEILLGRDAPLHLFAAAAVSGGELLSRRPSGPPSPFIRMADHNKSANWHLRNVTARILESPYASPDAVNRLLAALKQRETLLAKPRRRFLAIRRDVDWWMRPR